ncbi:hypothetical protein STAQ_49340 [Allostella sp. ATCC 35155]|nr:hypothetical protein STAQ_49340 [Stella sp. ATCC 35155]
MRINRVALARRAPACQPADRMGRIVFVNGVAAPTLAAGQVLDSPVASVRLRCLVPAAGLRAPHRVVHDQGLRVDVLQEMGRRDVGHVEGRVLPHQDDVHGGEVDRLPRAEAVVVALLAPHLQRAAAGHALPDAQHSALTPGPKVR